MLQFTIDDLLEVLEAMEGLCDSESEFGIDNIEEFKSLNFDSSA